MREQIDRALIGVSGAPLWRGTVNRDVAILSAAQPIFVGDDIVIVEVHRRSIIQKRTVGYSRRRCVLHRPKEKVVDKHLRILRIRI